MMFLLGFAHSNYFVKCAYISVSCFFYREINADCFNRYFIFYAISEKFDFCLWNLYICLCMFMCALSFVVLYIFVLVDMHMFVYAFVLNVYVYVWVWVLVCVYAWLFMWILCEYFIVLSFYVMFVFNSKIWWNLLWWEF